MTQIKVDATGETLDVSDDQLGTLAAKGGFSFPAGTQIPVRAPDGTVSSVPVEQYWQNQAQLSAATPQDVAAHQAKQAEAQAGAQEAALDEQYANGIGNFARAQAEAGLSGATMGASDWLLSQMGADPTGLKQRRERNAFTGAAEMAGMIIPAVLTGGGSAEAGIAARGALGVAETVARATPAALVERIGAAVGKKVAASVGEGFTSQLAGGTARLAAEGALSGIGGEVSARALDDKAVLDPGAMDEYLMAAGQGALIGGAMGAAGTLGAAGLGRAYQAGKAGAKKAAGYLGEMQGGAVREAEAGLTAATGEGDAILSNAKAVDYDANVRAATQRLDSLQAEDFGQTEAKSLREQARAKLAANAPTTPVLTSAGGMPAHSPLQEIGAAVKKEAKALGVSSDVADDAWSRIERGHQEFKAMDATHADTTRKVAATLDEMEAIKQRVDDSVGLARRNEALRGELAKDRTAAPPEQFIGAMKAQHERMHARIQEFLTDPDGQVASKARALDKHFKAQSKDLAALDMRDPAARADAFEILDQTNRLMGSARKRMGKRGGVQTLATATQDLYEETRQILKNPEIVGNRVAEISGRQKGNYTEMFSVDDGFSDALLRENAGGERSASGFETAARGDTAKISNFLKNVDSPGAQLDLEMVGRGIDTHAKLMQGFLDDLKPGGGAAKDLARYRELSKQVADDLVAYRSKLALAKEFAANALPGLKEVEGLDAKIAQANEKSAEKLGAGRAKIQEQIDSERIKADALRAKGLEKAAAQKDALIEKAQAKLAAVKDKTAESTAAGIVESMAPVLGLVFGGGSAAGYLGGQLAGKMLTPVIRSIARNGLTGMLKAQEKATQFAAVHAIGARISKATAGIVDRMHAARPYAAAAKTIALRAPRDTKEEFDRTMAWVDKAGPYDARAAYLKGIAPPSAQPLQMRADLDATPPVHPLAMRKFLRAARAAQDPAGALEDLANGVQTKEAADVLTNLYPTLKNRAITQIMDGASNMKVKPSMRSQQELSLFFGTPVHFTMKPEFVASVQSTYEQANAAGQGSQDMLEEQGGKPARQYNSKAGQMQATQTQRLEAGIT